MPTDGALRDEMDDDGTLAHAAKHAHVESDVRRFGASEVTWGTPGSGPEACLPGKGTCLPPSVGGNPPRQPTAGKSHRQRLAPPARADCSKRPEADKVPNKAFNSCSVT